MSAETEESSEHFFTAFTDLLVGVIFLFMLLLMVFALNLKNPKNKPVITSEMVRASILNEIAARMDARAMPIVLDLNSGIIRLPESMLFASGEWELLPEGRRAIESLAEKFAELLPCAARSDTPCDWQKQPIPIDSVLIEGHTDHRAFNGPNGFGNWELSAMRAITVYRTMVAHVPALATSVRNREQQPLIGISAYADTRPVSAESLDANRRIDVRFNMRGTKALLEVPQ